MADELDQLTNELHKPVRRHFKTSKVPQQPKDNIWSIDLVDMTEFASDNDNYKFILMCIDLGTRYAWAIPLKNKTAAAVTAAFETIMSSSSRQPNLIWADEGKEFYNTQFQQLCTDKRIKLYSTHTSDSHAAYVERLNRTIKSHMWKGFTRNQTHKWYDRLDTLIEDYNNSKHSGLNFKTPAAVSKQKSIKLIAKPVNTKSGTEKAAFQIGDKVRIAVKKGTFEKGYTANWSSEVFTVNSIVEAPNTRVRYKLIDYRFKPITGSFYKEELQKTKVPDTYMVEKVLSKKKINGVMHYHIKWLGFADEHNSWIPESDFIADFGKQA